MSTERTVPPMSDEGRALLTKREREILSEEIEVKDNYRYKVESTVRVRLRKHLKRDIDFMEEHFEEGYEIAIKDICGRIEEKDG